MEVRKIAPLEEHTHEALQPVPYRQRPLARAAFARVRVGRFVRPRPLPAARMSVRNASFTAAEFLNFLCTSGSMTTTLLLSR